MAPPYIISNFSVLSSVTLLCLWYAFLTISPVTDRSKRFSDSCPNLGMNTIFSPL